MSVYPLYFEYERPRPRRLLDQHFGLGLTPDDFLTIVAVPQINNNYYRPWRNIGASGEGSSIKADKDKFQINLDVQHFAPEEISVKTADGFLVVDGKHEEKQDEHGFISRSFTRRYQLPEGIDEASLTSKLSSDGILSISAPLQVPPKSSNERIVPIIQTGPVKKQIEGESDK
ncbi:protein lethal(2)essential for life-like [Leptidea sinapis]|uniref:protein lethal(2)essential for life-like n=1 Tax=Leptidea sinapis TaxID=189913 RepID=UPI0021C38531|nr:protein lethal(2)essential for life-like [Leptidea sinapis]